MPLEGALGGLVAIWDGDHLKKLDVLKENRILAIKFLSLEDNFIWAVSNIYGLNEELRRMEFLDILSRVRLRWWFLGAL